MTKLPKAPRTLLLGVEPGRWHARDHLAQGKFENGILAWVFAMRGSYACMDTIQAHELDRFDIVIANSHYSGGRHFARQIQLARERRSHTRWVTLVEGGTENYLRPHRHFCDLLDSSDLINCINIHAVPLFRSFTQTPVVNIGIPYPVAAVSELFCRHQNRDRRILLCPRLLERWNDFAVARELSLPYFGFEEKSDRWPRRLSKRLLPFNQSTPLDRHERVRQIYNAPHLEIRSPLGLLDFLKLGAKCLFWLNLDTRYTWARFVLDAAALGVPIITTRNTGHGPSLFPDTTVTDPFDIDHAKEIGLRLIEDAAFYRSVSETARERIDVFRPEKIRTQLLDALNAQTTCA